MDDILDSSASAPLVDTIEWWTSDRIRLWSLTLRENLAAWLQPNLHLVGGAE